MRTIFLLPLLVATASLAAGGQLDLAVIHFSDARDPAAIEAALSRVRLAEVVDADRTRTREAGLQGGSVLFAQSFPASPGTSFRTSTRLENLRADVSGRLRSGSLDVSVDIMEGVRAGLRNFQKRSYRGSSALPAGPARLISIRSGVLKAPYVVKGRPTLETTATTTIIAAQYTP